MGWRAINHIEVHSNYHVLTVAHMRGECISLTSHDGSFSSDSAKKVESTPLCKALVIQSVVDQLWSS